MSVCMLSPGVWVCGDALSSKRKDRAQTQLCTTKHQTQPDTGVDTHVSPQHRPARLHFHLPLALPARLIMKRIGLLSSKSCQHYSRHVRDEVKARARQI